MSGGQQVETLDAGQGFAARGGRADPLASGYPSRAERLSAKL